MNLLFPFVFTICCFSFVFVFVVGIFCNDDKINSIKIKTKTKTRNSEIIDFMCAQKLALGSVSLQNNKAKILKKKQKQMYDSLQQKSKGK